MSRFYLESFFFLNRFRRSGYGGPEPLEFSEIRTYAETIGLKGTESVTFFADILAGLDEVYLTYMREKKAEMEKAEAMKRKHAARR